MSYQVLARKWRPKQFAEVIGQTHVVRALQNALDLERLHHAYLFVGTRGVGKTTLARIFAKCLNCEAGVTREPCGECTACTQIDRGSFVDLIEIDAASRTGVDDMRDLLETVQFAPTAGRFKIYLIDEVHMLSTSSFNALLKTLEEPPEHVKFFFATTDPKKLPVTILSRCLKFNLTRLTTSEIAEQLTKVLTQEKTEFEEPAVKQISIFAEGSVRDALSLLDQAIAYGNGSLKTGEVEAMLGVADYGLTLDILRCIVQNDPAALFKKINDLHSLAVDFNAVLEGLLTLLNEVAMFQACPDVEPSAQFKPEEIAEFAAALTPEEVQLFYQIALHGKRDLPLLPEAKNAFEMTMTRMLGFKPMLADMTKVSSAPSSSQPAVSPKPVAKVPASASSKPAVKPQTFASPTDQAPAPIAQAPVSDAPRKTPAIALTEANSSERWAELIDEFGVRGATKELCYNSVLSVQNEHTVVLTVDAAYAALRNTDCEQEIRSAFEKKFGDGIKVEIKTSESDLENTPQKLCDAKTSQRNKQAREAIDNDDMVRELQENLGAKVIPGSVKSLRE